MKTNEQVNQEKGAGDFVCDRFVHVHRSGFARLLGFGQKQLVVSCALLIAGTVISSAQQNLLLPANGGVLNSYTAQFDATFSAANLTNGITNEAGWSSPRKPTGAYEFVYSFSGGNLARLTNAVIHGGTGEGRYYSENVEVWTSVDGVAYNLAGSGTLARAANQVLTVNLNNAVVKNIKLVIASGYDKNYWELAEFVANGSIVYPLVVNSGTGDGNYASGDAVLIQADTISGKTFDSWSVISGNPSFVNVNSSATTLIMAGGSAVVVAKYNSSPAWQQSPTISLTAQETAAFSDTLNDVATDPENDSLVFSKVDGPAWLSVANNGDLTGTPVDSNVGVNSFIVSLSDGVNPPVIANLEINVSPTAFTAWAIGQGISGRATDTDGDGLNNEFEYLMGLNPKAASNARLPAVSISAGRPAFTYTYRTDAVITYTVQTSTDLKTWTQADVAAGTPQPNGDGTSTITVVSNVSTSSAPKQFFRLQAVE